MGKRRRQPVVGGRASICQWELAFRFLTKRQCQDFIKMLMKDAIEYWVRVECHWAINLQRVCSDAEARRLSGRVGLMRCTCEAAAREARAKALEEAARIAESVGRPVGAGDGNTYIPGTSADAATAIRALIQTEGAKP